MKKLFAIALSIGLSVAGMAQVDRSVRPTAKPATELKFGDYDIIKLKNGLTIILVEDHKLPRVSMSLIIDRDPIFEGAKAGYVEMAGDMLRQGTTNRSKDSLDEEIDFMGAFLNTSSSSAYASGLSKYSEKLFELLADVSRNPAFPEAEFDKLKTQMISGIQSSKDDPDAVNARIFNQLLYGENHPYGESATEESVENISLEDCKSYYQAYWKPNVAYLAIVGDIKKRTVKKYAKKYFGDWAGGEIPSSNYPGVSNPPSMQIAVVDNENAVQSVVALGNSIQLEPGSPDEVKLRLANQILGNGSLGRLFQNIREDKGYTYGAYSNYDTDELVGEFTASASVRNEVTDSAVMEFLYEFDRMRSEKVSEDELQSAKNYIIGSIGRSLESPQTMASYALNTVMYNLPEDYYKNYTTRLSALTADDVMATSQKYILPNMQVCITGKATEIGDDLEAMGPVTYYNKDGEQIEKPSIELPEGLTAATVLENYTKALGGTAAIKQVKDITYVMKTEIAGAPFSPTTTIIEKENRFALTMEVEGMGALQKVRYNGKKGSQSGMQGSAEMGEEELAAMKKEAVLFPLTRTAELGLVAKLVGAEKVGERVAYAIAISADGEKLKTVYFDAESGLLVREMESEETPQGTMTTTTTYSDYQMIQGVAIAHKRVLNISGQEIKMSAMDIKINSGVKESAFN